MVPCESIQSRTDLEQHGRERAHDHVRLLLVERALLQSGNNVSDQLLNASYNLHESNYKFYKMEGSEVVVSNSPMSRHK